MGAFFQCLPQGKVTALTTVPDFLFDELPRARFERVDFACDVGLAQRSPTEIDFPETVRSLTSFWRNRERLAQEAAAVLRRRGCDMVVCDIAPLGVLAAERAGLPVALIENFTWDWIYRGLNGKNADLETFADDFAQIYARVGLHIQAEPICLPRPGCQRVGPISRPIKQDRVTLRKRLNKGDQDRLVLITMGGLATSWDALDPLLARPETTFLIPGQRGSRGNVVGLGMGSEFYHPDWVAAADLVVGKLGYSTVTELIQAGTPLAFLDRPDFPESAVLSRYLSESLSVAEVVDFHSETWLEELPQWAALARKPARQLTGAREAATLLCDYLGQSTTRTTIND